MSLAEIMKPGTREDDLREEAAWVAQALSGDQRGFEALMRRYHAPLHRMLRAILKNRDDTDDLLQETFVRAWRFLHRFDRERPFGPWLMRIGVNLARNQLRSRRAGTLSLDEPRETGEEEVYEGSWLADGRSLDELAYRRLLEQTRAALAHIPEEQRIVLEMRVLAEMSYQEIAEALDIPIGTVMSRLNRGRRRLIEALEGGSPSSPAIPPGASDDGARSESAEGTRARRLHAVSEEREAQ